MNYLKDDESRLLDKLVIAVLGFGWIIPLLLVSCGTLVLDAATERPNQEQINTSAQAEPIDTLLPSKAVETTQSAYVAPESVLTTTQAAYITPETIQTTTEAVYVPPAPVPVRTTTEAVYVPPAPAPVYTTTEAYVPPTQNEDVYYKNCAEARAAGAAPIRRGQPGYRAALDRDGDGVACERYHGR